MNVMIYRCWVIACSDVVDLVMMVSHSHLIDSAITLEIKSFIINHQIFFTKYVRYQRSGWRVLWLWCLVLARCPPVHERLREWAWTVEHGQEGQTGVHGIPGQVLLRLSVIQERGEARHLQIEDPTERLQQVSEGSLQVERKRGPTSHQSEVELSEEVGPGQTGQLAHPGPSSEGLVW